MKEQWCDHDNRYVTLADCVRCSQLCWYNPASHMSGLWSGELVRRWGSAEIEGFLESLKVAEVV